MDLQSILQREDIPLDIKEILIKEIEKNNKLMLSLKEEKFNFLEIWYQIPRIPPRTSLLFLLYLLRKVVC